MKNIFKKLICLMLVISIVLSFCSCSVRDIARKVVFGDDGVSNGFEMAIVVLLGYFIELSTPEKICFSLFGYSDLMLDENWIMGKTEKEVRRRYGGRKDFPEKILFPLGTKTFDDLSTFETYDCYTVYFFNFDDSDHVGEAYLIEKHKEVSYHTWLLVPHLF